MDGKTLAKEYVQKQKDIETNLAAINKLIANNEEVPKSLLDKYKKAKDEMQQLYSISVPNGVKH